MIKRTVQISLVVILSFAFLWVLSQHKTSPPSNKIQIIVSIIPMQEFVQAVAKDRAEVHVLIPPGIEPHAYEPTAQELISLEKADIWFTVGYLEFEAAHQETFAQLNPKMQIINTGKQATLRYFNQNEQRAHEKEAEAQGSVQPQPQISPDTGSASDQEIDPHLWLSPLNAIKQVEAIAQALSSLDPQNSGYYLANAQAYIQRLQNLHASLTQTLVPIVGSKLIVFHPAWGYFTDAYGLVQYPIEKEGKEPTPAELIQIIKAVQSDKIKVIFSQPQTSSQSAQSIASQTNSIVLQMDPLASNYIENLNKVGTMLAERLNTKP